MSDLRDVAGALKSFDKRITALQDCLLSLVRDSRQQSDWRHEQRNRAALDDGRREDSEKAMLQVQKACEAIDRRLAELVERLDTQASTRLSDVKELRARVRNLELGQEPTEEVTET